MKYGGASDGAYNLLRCSGANGFGALQDTGVGTSGAAFDVTAAKGSKIRIALSAAAKIRFAPIVPGVSAVTTFDATDSLAFPGTATAGLLLEAGVHERDVPVPSDGETGINLIVATVTGTVDVGIELA